MRQVSLVERRTYRRRNCCQWWLSNNIFSSKRLVCIAYTWLWLFYSFLQFELTDIAHGKAIHYIVHSFFLVIIETEFYARKNCYKKFEYGKIRCFSVISHLFNYCLNAFLKVFFCIFVGRNGKSIKKKISAHFINGHEGLLLNKKYN